MSAEKISLEKKLLHPDMLRALKLSEQLGRKLAEQHLEILDKYRSGATLAELANEYCSDLSFKVGLNAIYCCLREFVEGGYIEREELTEIGKKHMLVASKNNGSKGGSRTFELKHGRYDMTKKENQGGRKRGGERGGAITGPKNYEAGIGIAGMTKKERYAAGIKAAIKRGYAPFDRRTRRTEYGEMSELGYVAYLKAVKKESWEEIARRTIFYFHCKRSPQCFKAGYEKRRNRR